MTEYLAAQNYQGIVELGKKNKQGLTTEQVQQRQAQNLINHDATVPTKSIGAIIRENLCTLFNLVNAVLAFAVFSVGSYDRL